jgi:parvulin-like peptidyl-prolyl isomerase
MYHSPAVRDVIGIFFKRGHLLALAQGDGIYEADLRRALAEWRYASGSDEKDRYEENGDERLVLHRLISNVAARSLAAHEKISRAKVESELNVLRWQFRDEKTWRAVLRKSGLSARSIRRSIADDLRARRWLGRQIPSRGGATEDECRTFYDMHSQSFMQPARSRASHLFLTAPPETPPDVVETKQKMINSLAERIRHGERLSDVAATASEDEATKARGGDLGFFSDSRMPPDFFNAVVKMRVGEVSQPIRTRLGFHIVELTDSKPTRQMSFEEVQPEIRPAIENEKRRTALQSLTADLVHRAELIQKAGGGLETAAP